MEIVNRVETVFCGICCNGTSFEAVVPNDGPYAALMLWPRSR